MNNMNNMNSNNMNCSNCGSIICEFNKLLFVKRKNDILLTIYPNVLLDLVSSVLSIDQDYCRPFVKEMKCVNCETKVGSELLLYNDKGPQMIVFGVARVIISGIGKDPEDKWIKIYKEDTYKGIRVCSQEDYKTISRKQNNNAQKADVMRNEKQPSNDETLLLSSLSLESPLLQYSKQAMFQLKPNDIPPNFPIYINNELVVSNELGRRVKKEFSEHNGRPIGYGYDNISRDHPQDIHPTGYGYDNKSRDHKPQIASHVKSDKQEENWLDYNEVKKHVEKAYPNSNSQKTPSTIQSMKSPTKKEYSNYKANSREERIFFNLLDLKHKEVIMDQNDVQLFLGWLEVAPRKTDCLFQLEDPMGLGLFRLEQIVSMCDSVQKLRLLFIPMLKFFFHSSLEQALFKTKRDRMLFDLVATPYFLDKLSECCPSTALGSGNELICKLLTLYSLASLEARHSSVFIEIAKNMVAMEIEGSKALSSILLVRDQPDQPVVSKKVSEAKQVEPAWRTNEDPPGNRHDNDKYNFRDISIIPTSEEVMCSKPPYLPLANQKNRLKELDDVSFLLDYHFRLLRENFMHEIREAVQSGRSVTGAYAIDVHLGEVKNPKPCIVFEFDLPPKLAKLSEKDRKEAWMKFRGIEEGIVVAFRIHNQILRYGSIVVSRSDEKWLNSSSGPRIGINFERKSDLLDVLAELGNSSRKYEMVPASSNFFAVAPTLECLQSMITIPLRDELVDGVSSNVRPNVLPQIITLPEDFASVQVDLRNWSDQVIQESTTLDSSQTRALNISLTSRVSLIQGPPGTGKTFIGGLIARTILRNSKAKILCICYTNHALDQFLEYILAKSPSLKVARIGGKTQSKIIEPYSLFNLTKNESRTFEVKRNMATLFTKMESITTKIDQLKRFIPEEISWQELRDFLKFEARDIYAQLVFSPTDEEGFSRVGGDGQALKDNYLWNCWKSGNNYPFKLNESFRNGISIWSMSQLERADLISIWHQAIYQPVREEIATLFRRFSDISRDLELQKRESFRIVLSESRLIGATTTGAAKYKDLIEAARADVIITEEAGEVLEAQVLTSLSESVKQLILIGDHKQLRPKVESYDLTVTAGRGFNLDCSLFERLITTSKLPASMLLVQHRMRPEISQIIRMSTYPELQDYPGVSLHPHILGISKDILFFDHKELEGQSKHSNSALYQDRSKVNDYEARMSVELVRLLLLQGFKHSQLVVLTPYLGQLRSIHLHMKQELKDVNALVSDLDRSDLIKDGYLEDDDDNEGKGVSGSKGVRVSTVDNYQGEESDVVIISLVRSNERGDIGFLKEPQRVNVMLSRARNGMILLGNSSTLVTSSRGSAVWLPIVNYFKELNCFVDAIPSYCQLHPEDIVSLSNPVDFRRLRVNGGCGLSCKSRLKCGHPCPLKCHVFDHLLIKCSESCSKIPEGCPFNHSCPKRCWESCGPCSTPISLTLPCHHDQFEPCHKGNDTKSILCKSVLTVELSCKHMLSTYCSNVVRGKSELLCNQNCLTPLACGHNCNGRCGKCKEKGHLKCRTVCDRQLNCGHFCSSQCHDGMPCPPCQSECTIKCPHSNCTEPCSAPCSPCVKECNWRCEHQGQCLLPCSAPCSRLPCDKRCTLLLECGHQCPSVCGEACPSLDYCQVCGSKGDAMVDLITGASYSEVDLATDPILCLSCHHFFVMSTLDGHMELGEFYNKNEVGEWVSAVPMDKAIYLTKPKTCPECRCVASNLVRYGRVTKGAELGFLDLKHSNSIRVLLLQESSQESSQESNMQLIRLLNLLKKVRKGPRRIIYEASKGVDVDFPHPSPSLLTKILLLIGDYYLKRLTSESNSDHYITYFDEGISYLNECQDIADETMSFKSGAEVRLLKATLINSLIERVSGNESKLTERNIILNWVISNESAAVSAEQKDHATKLKRTNTISDEERKSIVAAMGGEYAGEYGRGQWYECPNGHEYYIGNCGQAVSSGICAECGSSIGGNGRLFGSNRVAHNIHEVRSRVT